MDNYEIIYIFVESGNNIYQPIKHYRPMKKSYLMLLLVAMFTLVACDFNESQVEIGTTEVGQEAIVGGKVPFARALSNADFVFKNIESLNQKQRKVKSVDVLTKSKTNSRISRTSLQDEQEAPLAYVVNYENNEGFAILAADTKLPPVISIGDEGNFNTEGFIEFTGNGGNTRSGADSELNPAQEIQYALVNNSLLLPPILPPAIDDNTANCVDTTIVIKCFPLVRTKWGQTLPYNYYAPLDPEDEDKISYAGCGPVAAAQVLAALSFHRNWRPTTQLSDEYHVNWYTINRMIFNGVTSFQDDDNSADALAVASLIRAFGEAAESSYKYHGGTSTYVSKMNSAFERLGLTNVDYIEVDTNASTVRDEIFNMVLNNNYPVIVRADNSNNVKDKHFFVLDGWLRLEYSIVTSELIDLGGHDTFVRIDNTQCSFDLAHINLGWDGFCDGYYLPDAFDLTERKYQDYAEPNESGSGNYVYDLNVGYIVYGMQ